MTAPHYPIPQGTTPERHQRVLDQIDAHALPAIPDLPTSNRHKEFANVLANRGLAAARAVCSKRTDWIALAALLRMAADQCLVRGESSLRLVYEDRFCEGLRQPIESFADVARARIDPDAIDEWVQGLEREMCPRCRESVGSGEAVGVSPLSIMLSRRYAHPINPAQTEGEVVEGVLEHPAQVLEKLGGVEGLRTYCEEQWGAMFGEPVTSMLLDQIDRIDMVKVVEIAQLWQRGNHEHLDQARRDLMAWCLDEIDTLTLLERLDCEQDGGLAQAIAEIEPYVREAMAIYHAAVAAAP